MSFIDWWRHKQFLVDRANMDWDGLKVEVIDMLCQLRGEVVPTFLAVQRLVLENSMSVELSSCPGKAGA